MNTDALRKLWKEAFGDTDAFLDGFFRTGFSPHRCLTATREGQLVGALYWFDCLWEGRKLAYIYAVATAKAFRGQGICRELMERCHKNLAEKGHWGAVLVPAQPELSALYEKFGYRHFGGMQPISLAAGVSPVALEEISPAVYARRKAALLPAGAVIQEGPLLDFLATYARFYAGDGFLCAVATEDRTGWFQEYFGPVEQASGILRTLGLSQGHLRIPDGKTPFAMFRSFSPCDSSPSYLGIPLD